MAAAESNSAANFAQHLTMHTPDGFGNWGTSVPAFGPRVDRKNGECPACPQIYEFTAESGAKVLRGNYRVPTSGEEMVPLPSVPAFPAFPAFPIYHAFIMDIPD